MAKEIKRFCLFMFALCPVVAISFAAQSALSVDQIRQGNASDVVLQASGPLSQAEGTAQKP